MLADPVLYLHGLPARPMSFAILNLFGANPPAPVRALLYNPDPTAVSGLMPPHRPGSALKRTLLPGHLAPSECSA